MHRRRHTHSLVLIRLAVGQQGTCGYRIWSSLSHGGCCPHCIAMRSASSRQHLRLQPIICPAWVRQIHLSPRRCRRRAAVVAPSALSVGRNRRKTRYPRPLRRHRCTSAAMSRQRRWQPFTCDASARRSVLLNREGATSVVVPTCCNNAPKTSGVSSTCHGVITIDVDVRRFSARRCAPRPAGLRDGHRRQNKDEWRSSVY